jgi:hypothetical protein
MRSCLGKWMLLVSSAGLLAGCGGGGSTQPPPPTPVAPTISPTALTFPSTVATTTSAAQTVTVTNSGQAALNGTISITGADAADFAQTNTCGTSLAGGASCTISVTFTPTAAGTFTASLTGSASGVSYPTVALSGTGTPAPAAQLSSTSVAMGSVAYGASSAPQTITLTNSGGAGLTVSTVAISGADSGDFTETDTCSGTTLAAGATCTATVTFTPTALNQRTATLTFTDNATAGTTQTVALSGTGMAAITAVVPDSGPLAGGTIVSIEGLGLPTTGATVTVGGVAATNVSASSDGTLLEATMPAGTAAGAAAVAVNGAASSAQFTYSADVPGCGSNCGDVGDPYEGKGAPTSYIPLSSCQQITATGYYLVTQNLSGTISSTDSNCLELYFPSPEPSATNPVTIDLGGFTVNGTVSIQANSGPVTLMNGTVDCNAAGSECINFGVDTGRIHHLTVENASPTALANIDVTGITASTNVAPTLLIDHLTSTVAATQAGQPRSRNIMDDGANGSNPATESLPLEAFDNLITCSDNASACQGVELFDAPHSYVYHNKIVLPSSCIGCTDTPRAILFDHDSNYGVAAFNELDLNGTNRGVRVREAQHISIHDNAFNLIWASDPDPVESGEARAGAVHIGENNYTLDDDYVDVYNNTFEFEGPGGVAVNSCEAADVYAFDNTATCQTTGCSNNIFGQTDVVDTAAQNPQAQTGTTINVFNDDLSALTTPTLHICGENPSGAFDCHGSTTAVTTGTACNLGASVVFTGYGTVNQVTAPCRPAPPVPPVPQVSAFVVTRPGAAAPARTGQQAATPAAGAGPGRR